MKDITGKKLSIGGVMDKIVKPGKATLKTDIGKVNIKGFGGGMGHGKKYGKKEDEDESDCD
jgi:hypothetical protein